MKITYLLGAGASANFLPINKKNLSGEKTNSFIAELKMFRDTYVHRAGDPTIVARLDEILKICAEMGTPDLCAKFLLETGNDTLYQLLKIFLSNYFTFKQTLSEIAPSIFGNTINPESRPLSFLTTIINNKKLPENIHVLSWNYDSLMEIAATKLKLSGSPASEKVQGFSCWPNTTEGQQIDDTKNIPFLFHINGVAGYNYSARNFSEKQPEFYDFSHGKESLLSFAWETNDNVEKKTFTENRERIAGNVSAGTEILIVVGYSFPFFNREFDKIILSKMMPTLKTIYFQDPNIDGSFLRAQFGVPGTINIAHIQNVNQYYIPYEL